MLFSFRKATSPKRPPLVLAPVQLDLDAAPLPVMPNPYPEHRELRLKRQTRDHGLKRQLVTVAMGAI